MVANVRKKKAKASTTTKSRAVSKVKKAKAGATKLAKTKTAVRSKATSKQAKPTAKTAIKATAKPIVKGKAAAAKSQAASNLKTAIKKPIAKAAKTKVEPNKKSKLTSTVAAKSDKAVRAAVTQRSAGSTISSSFSKAKNINITSKSGAVNKDSEAKTGSNSKIDTAKNKQALAKATPEAKSSISAAALKRLQEKPASNNVLNFEQKGFSLATKKLKQDQDKEVLQAKKNHVAEDEVEEEFDRPIYGASQPGTIADESDDYGLLGDLDALDTDEDEVVDEEDEGSNVSDISDDEEEPDVYVGKNLVKKKHGIAKAKNSGKAKVAVTSSAHKHDDYMNESQLAHFRQLLEKWRRELMAEVDHTITEMKEAINFADPNDRATQEETFGLELRTRDRERKLLKKIEEALQQIEDQEYGYCETCGVEIGVQRLEARPTATLCIDCKTLAEIREKRA